MSKNTMFKILNEQEVICSCYDETTHMFWTSQLFVVEECREVVVIQISSREQDYIVILNDTFLGKHLSIISYNVCVPLSYLNDIFWNTEMLEKHIPRIEAITIGYSLNAYYELLNELYTKNQ